MMTTSRFAENILLYEFPADPGTHYGYNLYALLDEQEKTATLLDAANEPQAEQVRRDLSARGYRIARVILSHFHHDHIFGLRELPGVEIVGSPQYEETLALLGGKEAGRPFLPTRVVTEDDELGVGPFRLRFVDAPGHSACSRYTLIDEDYVHVGDNLMRSARGEALFPWVRFEGLVAHIDSLERLRAYADRIILPSHGPAIRGVAAVHREIDDRLLVLRAMLESEGEAAYEDIVQGCSQPFLHAEWHRAARRRSRRSG